MGGTDLRDAAQSVRQLSTAIEQTVDREIETVMQRTAAAARQHLATGSDRQVATGTLINVTKHTDEGLESITNLFDDTYVSHAVESAAPHAKYVEYGTGIRQRGGPQGIKFKSPSAPPTNEIYEWIETKGITADNPNLRNPDGSTNKVALAEAIAESIATYGSQPHPFLRPAWKENRQGLSRAHKRGVRKALRRSF